MFMAYHVFCMVLLQLNPDRLMAYDNVQQIVHQLIRIRINQIVPLIKRTMTADHLTYHILSVDLHVISILVLIPSSIFILCR